MGFAAFNGLRDSQHAPLALSAYSHYPWGAMGERAQGCVCVAPARTQRDELGHLQLLLQRVDALPRVDQPHVVQHVGMPEHLHHRRSQALGHNMAVPHPDHPLLSLAHLLPFLPNTFTCVSPSVPAPRAASSVIRCPTLAAHMDMTMDLASAHEGWSSGSA